jgi:PAS domain S-box-containing protein
LLSNKQILLILNLKNTKTRVIVFSSNKNIVENISNIISKYFNIVSLSSSERLIHLCKEDKDDIIVIDSDVELCTKLKSFQNFDNPIVLIMPAGNETDFHEIEKSCADAYLEYPFSSNELLTGVHILLNERKQRKNFKQITSVTKESEQKYKRLFQLSPDAMGYHVGGKIGFINDSGIKILGASSFEEVFGKYFLDFIHPFDKEFVYEKTKIIPRDKPLYLESRIVTLDGRTKYIDLASTPFLLGGVNAVQFIFRDITEKKINELNLVEFNTRLEFVQKIAKLSYWEYDLRNKKIIWSKDIYEMWGVSEKNFQPSIKNVLNLIHPEDRDKFQKALDTSLSGVISLDIEHRVTKPDGQILYVNQRGAVVYDEKGRIVKFSASVQDITERKLMEDAIIENQSRLSNIINSAMDAVITVDSNQNIILFNITAEKMFRCTADDVIGKSLDKFIPARFREIHKKHIENFGKTGITMRTMGAINPISGLRTDGEEFPIEASISQVEVGGQKLYTVIIRDITEKKIAEEALISSEARYRLLFKKILFL